MRAMPWVEASIAEIRQEDGLYTVRIDCPDHAIPAPGQYVVATLSTYTVAESDFANAVTLFPTEFSPAGFCAVPAYPDANVCRLPATWQPGGQLLLRGPLGRGFCLPGDVRHLALVAAGNTITRLAPLIVQGQMKADIVLCTDLSAGALTSSVEIYPLSSFPEISPWADFVAIDLLLDGLPHLRKQLGLAPEQILPCPVQALILTPMPCSGLAKCGVCAVSGRRGYRLVCEDGPVFELSQLAW